MAEQKTRRGLLDSVVDAYNSYIGRPFASVAGGAINGYLGFERPGFANEQVYRTAQALSGMPGVGAPAGVIKAAAHAPEALVALGGLLGKTGVGKLAQSAPKLKAPQDEALEIARKNAVKMLALPENNTAIDRARAMGFSESYHGTNRHVDQIDPNKAGTQTGNPNAHMGFFSTPNADEASRYTRDFGGPAGGNVMPLMIRRGNEYPISYKEMNDIAMGLFTAPGNTTRERYLSASQTAKDKRENLISEGYDTAVFGKGKPLEEIIALKPEVVRSRFAAFDPARINENDLLGFADPRLLALIGAGTGGGLLGYNYLNER